MKKKIVNESMQPFEVLYPDLTQAAYEIADITCFMINKRARHITEGPEYRAQGILEYVITILKERV